MPKFKQTRPKETGGGGMSNRTETRVIECDTQPVSLYITTEPVGAASQLHDWKDDPAPSATPKGEDK